MIDDDEVSLAIKVNLKMRMNTHQVANKVGKDRNVFPMFKAFTNECCK